MKLFKKPKWLLPEIDELAYWVHLLIIVFILNIFIPLPIFKSVLVLAGADILAHSILGLS